MKDITNPKVIWMKGILFLVLGTGSAALVFLEAPSVRAGVLLGLAIWAFCRAYYFAFYVIEKYVDPTCRFSGLISFTRYVLWRKTR